MLFRKGGAVITSSDAAIIRTLGLLPGSASVAIIAGSARVFQRFRRSTVGFVSANNRCGGGSYSLRKRLTGAGVTGCGMDLTLVDYGNIDVRGKIRSAGRDRTRMGGTVLTPTSRITLLMSSSGFSRSTFIDLVKLSGMGCVVASDEPSSR